MKDGLVSVVLPIYNGLPVLHRQLDALAAQDDAGSWELLLADNGSSDASADVAKKSLDRFPLARFIDVSARPGFSAACNIAVESAEGEFLCFTGQDDVVSPGWVSAMRTALEDADIVAGAIDLTSVNPAEHRTWDPTSDDRQSGPARSLHFLPYAIGTNLGIRAQTFRALGGWDESLESGEDLDLSWRAQLEGYRFAYAPEAVMAFALQVEPEAARARAIKYASSSPALYARFRERGMPRSSTSMALRDWSWIALHAWSGRRGGPEIRGLWNRRLGMRLGRLKGTLRYRVWFP